MKTTNCMRHKGDTPAGRKILSALYDLADTLERGIPLEQKYTLRHVSIADPGDYTPADVKRLRRKLGLSQPVFARLLGAASGVVQKWEAGERHPDGMARRLLDDIQEDPQRWLKRFTPVHARAKAG